MSALRRAVQSVAPAVRPGSAAAALETMLIRPRPTTALAALLFVRWAEQMCGGRLARADRSALESVQAHLFAYGLICDRIADDEPGARDEALDLLPLSFAMHERLSRLFAPCAPFWAQYRRLFREQVAVNRWERNRGAPQCFDPALIRRLGKKATLARWPAAAVAERIGRGEMAPRIERDFQKLLLALQLVDDLIDAEEDGRSGQINAVLAAAPGSESGLELHARIVRGIPPVWGVARMRLQSLSQRHDGLGEFAAWFLATAADVERRAVHAARARGFAAILQRMLDALDDSERPRRHTQFRAESPVESHRANKRGRVR